MKVLITGSAGFIGFHLAKRLLSEGITVIGIDDFNNYYSSSLKYARNEILVQEAKRNKVDFFYFLEKIEDCVSLQNIFEKYKPNTVVNLAAQAGVRYSIENPSVYIQSNLVGFGNILELCRKHDVQNLIYASSSSVYGGNTKKPFSEEDNVDHPVSLYAATKKSNELMAHAYSHLYDIPSIGLRFFTVYGPWGRPDMALFLFTKAILKGEPINVFNNGNMLRDFTYIDDLVESMYRLLGKPALEDKNFNFQNPSAATSWKRYRIFNIGNANPINLMEYINVIEKCLNKKAILNKMPMQPGDVKETFADTKLLSDWVNYKPQTSIEEGVEKFVDWYINYYKDSI